MNLYRKLVNFFTTPVEVPEVKERIKLFPKNNTLDAQLYIDGKWRSVKSIDLNFVAPDVARDRAEKALKAYKELNFDDKGVLL